MINNNAINLDTPDPGLTGSSIDFNDWSIPDVPKPSLGSGWADNFNISAPPDTAGNKPFPEYAVINANDIHNLMDTLTKSFDVGMGVAKTVVPGLAGFGDLLGAFGHSIDSNPVVGPALGAVKDFATNTAQELAGAVTRRGGQMLDEWGHTLVADPVQSLMNILSLPEREAITAALGETGQKALHGTFDFASAPRDIMDSLEIASLIPAFKGAGMLLKGETGGAVGGFLKGLTNPLEDLQFAKLSTQAGIITSRISLGIEGVGLGAQFALPKLAPDQPWAKDILSTRVVADDSPWRFPFEAATSLPMDITGLFKFGAESRLASWGAEKAFGLAPLPSEIVMGKDILSNALKGGILTSKELNMLDDHAFRKVTEDFIVRSWNALHSDNVAASIKDLPMTQDQASALIRTRMASLEQAYGRKAFSQMAADNMVQNFEGWEGLTHAEQLQQFSDYAKNALEIEATMPGTTVTVAQDIINMRLQAPDAFDYLTNEINNGTFTDATVKSLANRYPAMAQKVTEIGADPVRLQKELMGIAGGADDLLPSLRAQLRESNARLTTLQDKMAALEGEHAMTPTTGYYDELTKAFQDESKKATDLSTQIGLAERPSIGTMESMLDTLNKRIISGETSLAAERQSLLGKIKDAREAFATDINKQILTIKNAIASREDEAMMAPMHQDQMALDMESEANQQQISKLAKDYYEARLAGSRWAVSYDSRQPMMRLVDATGEYTRADRTLAGKVFDTLFAGIPNKEISFQAEKYIRDTLAMNSQTKVDGFLNELHDRLAPFQQEYKSGFKHAMFGSIYHLPPFMINHAAEKLALELPAGMKASEIIYRSMPGPLKIFQNQVFGKELVQMPYNEMFHSVSRSLYPALRFYMSPRFLAMNMYESQTIGGALGGAKYLGAPIDQQLLSMSKTLLPNMGTEVWERGGKKMAENIAKLAYTKRPDEVMKAIMDTVHAQPEMADYAKQLGTKDQWYAATTKLMNDRLDAAKLLGSKTAAEQSLADQITNLKADLKSGVGDELLKRSEIQRLETQWTTAKVEREMAAVDETKLLAGQAKYEPFLNAIKQNEIKMVESIRQTFYGNPARSAVERVLNSFLLYWPISYQIKATKIIGEFLTSRAFGFDTNFLGSATYSHMAAAHQEKMQNDPTYRNFFNSNKNLLSLLEQMLPITPEGMGVTLSPLVRVPYHIATGSTTPGQGITQLGSIGPVHDVSIVGRIFAEQTKPGGLYFDIFGGK